MELRFPNTQRSTQAFALGLMLIISIGCGVTNIHSSKSISEITSQQQAQEIIQVGMTMEQVIARLGKPTNQSSYNGITRWNYVNQKTNYTGKKLISAGLGLAVLPDQKILGVSFGTDGLVQSVDFSQQSF